MKIFIYGDSNTFGQIPNIDGYSKNAKINRYKDNEIWWYPLTKTNEVIVNGLPGRAINNENPWLKGRNATETINQDLDGIAPDIVIIQLGTNDCKTAYGLSANQITAQLYDLIKIIKNKVSDSEIIVISPATIKEGNIITDKYYCGAEQKSQNLDNCYCKLCKEKGFYFVSGKDLQVGEDGEHLTKSSHEMLGKRILSIIDIIYSKNNQLC